MNTLRKKSSLNKCSDISLVKQTLYTQRSRRRKEEKEGKWDREKGGRESRPA